MRNLRHAGTLWRLACDLRPFLHQPILPHHATATVQQRLLNRQSIFLRMAEQNIYGHPGSPYLALLRMAGCELSDLQRLVTQQGLETTLEQLMEAGVYVTFDELKGRKEVIRGSQRFSFIESDFDNPSLSSHLVLSSSGTRGPGTRVWMALDYIADFAVNTAVSLQVHGLAASEHVIWVLPTGLIFALRHAKLGRPPIACFYPLRPPSRTMRVGSWLLAAASQWTPGNLPRPRSFELGRTAEMVDWLRGPDHSGKSICVTSYASAAVRTSLAAQDQGRTLQGISFITLGEPVTEAKKQIIEASGARMLVHFGTTETGFIGFSCGRPQAADDIHLFKDCFALVQRPRRVGSSEVTVKALALTSLLYSAPKILLNAETGDHGIVERRRCGCGFDSIGFDTHIEKIRSFEKLSSEGMTFAQAELLELLESKLPAEFGGTATDYQVLEQQLVGGTQRVSLVISPEVGPIDEARARQLFLGELAAVGMLGPTGAEVWEWADTVAVERRFPLTTRAGKILPFHVLED